MVSVVIKINCIPNPKLHSQKRNNFRGPNRGDLVRISEPHLGGLPANQPIWRGINLRERAAGIIS